MVSDAQELIKNIAQVLRAREQSLTVAESCTGGWVAKECTDAPGSSEWFERGFVTYSNVAKIEMLGVSEDTLTSYGAVSEQVVTEMAAGALRNSCAHWSIAISGIAGPDGGTSVNPVGTVWFAWMQNTHNAELSKMKFEGNRNQVRAQSVYFALERLNSLLI